MTAWRKSASGVLIHTEHKPRPFMWPRPAGWAELPPDIRAAWDARWRKVGERVQGARA